MFELSSILLLNLMKTLFTFVFLIGFVGAFAQKQNVYLYKNDGTEVSSPDSADYMQIVREPDSGSVLYKVFEYYKNRNTKSVGTSSTVHPVTLEESSIGYYSNGKRKTLLNYRKGRLTGKQFYFYPNGHLFQELLYTADEEQNDNYQIITVADTAGKLWVTNGEGYYKKYNEAFTLIIEEGPVKKGIRDSVWKGTDEALKVTFNEHYHLGNLIEGVSTDSSNKQFKYSAFRIKPLQYKDGLKSFYTYLTHNLRAPASYNKSSTQYEAAISFFVNPNKTLTDFVIIKSGGVKNLIKILKNFVKKRLKTGSPKKGMVYLFQ